MKVRVVLVRPQGPINLGLIARACANMAVSDLRLVAPCCGVDNMEARMFAHHAWDLLQAAPVHATLPEALRHCDWVVGTSARKRRDTLVPLLPDDLGRTAEARGTRRLAIVFGSESDGLTRSELEACDAVMRLATPGPYKSYNLSHAVAITLYAVCGREQEAPRARMNAATHEQVERLQALWLSTLERAGYFRRTDVGRFAPKLRRMLGRWDLEPADVHRVAGMLMHLAGHKKRPPRDK